MHVMFMCQCYAPEDVSGAVLVTELAVDLVKRGHQVTFVTAAPSYPLGVVFPGYRNRLYQVEWLEGVKVVRTWSYIASKKTFWRQIFHYGTYCLTALYGGLFAGKPDIIVNYSPPLPLGITAWLLSRIWKIPWLIQIEDLYPEAAVVAGLLRNRWAISFFTKMELFLYHRATHISIISEIFHKKILEKGIPDSKLSVIPVWADPDLVHPMDKDNGFRQAHGLTGKFVILYAGNMGRTSSLDDVIFAAEILKDEPDLRFVMVGEGVKKDGLEEMVSRKKIGNVMFLPFQPRSLFNELLAAADVGLVTLNLGASQSSLPSKTFNIMASGRPIIAVTPKDSELADVVVSSCCGIQVPPHAPELLAQAILELKQQESMSNQMAINGREQLERKYCRYVCVEAFEELFVKLNLGR